MNNESRLRSIKSVYGKMVVPEPFVLPKIIGGATALLLLSTRPDTLVIREMPIEAPVWLSLGWVQKVDLSELKFNPANLHGPCRNIYWQLFKDARVQCLITPRKTVYYAGCYFIHEALRELVILDEDVNPDFLTVMLTPRTWRQLRNLELPGNCQSDKLDYVAGNEDLHTLVINGGWDCLEKQTHLMTRLPCLKRVEFRNVTYSASGVVQGIDKYRVPFHLTSVRELVVDGEYPNGADTACILEVAFPMVNHLTIHGNEYTDKDHFYLCAGLSANRALLTLDISYTDVTDNSFQWTAQLTTLQLLDIRGTAISVGAVDALSHTLKDLCAVCLPDGSDRISYTGRPGVILM